MGGAKHLQRECRKDIKWDQPCVTCVFFEGEAQQSNLFTSNSVEEAINYPAGKPPPLVLIHVYHLTKWQRLRMRWIQRAETFRGNKKKKMRCYVSPAASRRLPQAGSAPRTGTPDSARPSGNSFHQNLPRVDTEGNTSSVFNWFKFYIEAPSKHLWDRFLTYAGFEKLAAYSLVHTDCLRNLLHVGPGGLTQSTDTVDAADSLGQECIGCLHKHKSYFFLDCTYDIYKLVKVVVLQSNITNICWFKLLKCDFDTLTENVLNHCFIIKKIIA